MTTEPAGAHEVRIGPVGLAGTLGLPRPGHGIVLFAHGSGSSRLSPRNVFVATELQQAGFGTLLFDLLTEAEARDRGNVFDIELLAGRLLLATEWLRTRPATRDLPLGYFGASTGAAAALLASTRARPAVGAIVSRGGRPDLAGPVLAEVTAPTLLIVGSHDEVVLDLNRRALAAMVCERELAVVEGAGHLFEEPRTLEAVIDLAQRWFAARLKPV